MAFVNRDAIKGALANLGEEITVTHYTGDMTYDSSQNPTRSSSDSTTKAEIKTPNKFEIEASGGALTLDDKKFCIEGEVDIDKDDLVIIGSTTTEPFKVKQVKKTKISGNITKISAFGTRIQ